MKTTGQAGSRTDRLLPQRTYELQVSNNTLCYVSSTYLSVVHSIQLVSSPGFNGPNVGGPTSTPNAIARIRFEGAGHRRTLDIIFGDTSTAGGRSELQDLCVVSAVLLLCREELR